MKTADICLGSRTSGAASRNWAKRRLKSLREQVASPAKRPGAGELEVGLLEPDGALFDGQRSFVRSLRWNVGEQTCCLLQGDK
jgi:hypothetical protein